MRCGKMLKDEVAEYCEDCAKRKSYITQGRSLWLHQKPVSDALYRFKYHNKRCYGLVFSEKLAEKYEKKLKEWKIGLILPIPLHWKRKRKRGYNQAEILARELGKRTGLAVCTDRLLRIRNTRPLKLFDRKERMEVLQGAFAVRIQSTVRSPEGRAVRPAPARRQRGPRPPPEQIPAAQFSFEYISFQHPPVMPAPAKRVCHSSSSNRNTASMVRPK